MVVTITERKVLETERRRRAVDQIAGTLADFAAANGGRFIVYGSAAADRLRYDSDLDVLLDFSVEREPEAWRLVEDLGAVHGIPVDVKPLRWCSETFLARVLAGARSLP